MSSKGRAVAERAKRWNSPANSTKRSRPVNNCTPRRFSTTAWISSNTTVSTVASACRPRTVESSKSKLSGVVISSSGGRRNNRRRSPASVSPLRTRTAMSGNAAPDASKRARISAMGTSRLARMSLPSAFNGETYNTRVAPGRHAPVANALIAHKNAVSVLPLPVGAATNRCSPAAMRGQHRAWTSVGAPKASANQRPTWG